MKSHEEPLVTVLTPVYNGALYLRECIESVLAQTYTNWNYVIVNNASTDGTLQIAQEYANKDARIKVYTNDKLLDIIANHNRAFRLISPKSKYCKVVSADDWLLPECVQRLVAVAETNPSVGIVGSYQVSGGGTDWSGWSVRWSEIPYQVSAVSGTEVCRIRLLGGSYVFGNPTSVLYRSDLIRAQESFYPNSTAEADASACFKYLQDSDFGFVHQVLSYERIHGNQMSEKCRTMNAYAPAGLNDLVEYGPKYLTKEEIQARKKEILDSYYAFLAVSAIHFREKSFWDYHKERLKDCGCPLSKLRLAGAVLAKCVDLLLNPKQTIEKFVNPGTDTVRGPAVATTSSSVPGMSVSAKS